MCPASAWLREEASSVRVNVQKLLVTSEVKRLWLLLLMLLLLRHIIMKMERVQLVDQVRTAGDSVDAAHIGEKRSKSRVS